MLCLDPQLPCNGTCRCVWTANWSPAGVDIAIVEARNTYAGGFASRAIGAGHRVTIVGPSCGQAEAFATKIRAATATGPNDPIVANVVIDMPYNCVS